MASAQGKTGQQGGQLPAASTTWTGNLDPRTTARTQAAITKVINREQVVPASPLAVFLTTTLTDTERISRLVEIVKYNRADW